MTTPALHQLDYFPPHLLDIAAENLYQYLPGPTLIHLQGDNARPLFVSVLLHGNETTGWQAVQHLLKRYQNRALPRSLSIFIGNIQAARYQQRHLPEQPDYNRIWPGGADTNSPEAKLMQQVIAEMTQRDVFASLDIHNNTGKNPHYACVNLLQPAYLNLARFFSRTVVYFKQPTGVQSMAMSQLCPATTVECGQASDPAGTQHAAQLIDICLNLAHVPTLEVAYDIDLFHTVAVVKLLPTVSFSFTDPTADVLLSPRLDNLNFHEQPAGTHFAQVKTNTEKNTVVLSVRNEAGEEVNCTYFTVQHGALCTTRPLMPSMLTLNEQIIEQDCLCYLMERLPLSASVVDEVEGTEGKISLRG